MTITLSSWELSRLSSGDLHAAEIGLFPHDEPLRAAISIDTATGHLVWGEAA